MPPETTLEAEIARANRAEEQLLLATDFVRDLSSRLERSGFSTPPRVLTWLKERGLSPHPQPLYVANPIGILRQRPTLRYLIATLPMITDMYWEMSGSEATSVRIEEVFAWFREQGWEWKE